MLSRSLWARNNFVRILLCSALVLSVVFSILLVLTPASTARPQVTRTETTPAGKRRRIEFVPGRALVRYKSESIANNQQRATSALRVGDREPPVQIDNSKSAGLSEGLRIGRFPEAETLTALAA